MDLDRLAERTVALLYARRPELVKRYGPLGRDKCAEDMKQTVLFLAEAVNNQSYLLFSDYICWLKTLFLKLGIDHQDMTDSLRCMSSLVSDCWPEPAAKTAIVMLEKALADLDTLPVDAVSFVEGSGISSILARDYLNALLGGDKRQAFDMIMSRAERGLPIKDIYLKVFEPVLRETGRLWHNGMITVADEHFVTAATQATMSRLYPYIFSSKPVGRAMVATCVSGELHEIGMRMVADIFELAGWDSFYLGASVPAKDVVATLREREAAVLGISATLTRHLGHVGELVAMARAELGPSLIILVGGYPFNVDRDLWRRVGADGMGTDAMAAVECVSMIEAAR